MTKYIKINLHGGGNYIQPKDKLMDAIEAELDCLSLDFEPKITITFEAVDMTDEEYEKLPEFEGH